MPHYGPQVIRESLTNLAGITGLRFRELGMTDELISGERYTPEAISIGWVLPGQSPYLKSDELGIAIVMPEPTGRQNRVGGATISLLDYRAYFSSTDDYWRTAFRRVLDHEMGHVLGLDHVNDMNQLMYLTGGNTNEYASGDLQGLTYVGSSGGCTR